MSDEKLNPNSTLDKVLGYVDSPFKLFAILVMGVVAFVWVYVLAKSIVPNLCVPRAEEDAKHPRRAS
jgi:hypothetical protein